MSIYSLVDLLAIVPWYLAAGDVPGADAADEYLRMLRLLRLVSLEQHIPSVSLLGEVFASQKSGLIVTGFVTTVVWLVSSTLLYICEEDDTVIRDHDNMSMAERFRNVPNSLQYTLLLLTRDYPFMNFTGWGVVVNVFMIISASGVIAVPTSLICNGFTDILAEQRKRRASEGQIRPHSPNPSYDRSQCC